MRLPGRRGSFFFLLFPPSPPPDGHAKLKAEGCPPPPLPLKEKGRQGLPFSPEEAEKISLPVIFFFRGREEGGKRDSPPTSPPPLFPRGDTLMEHAPAIVTSPFLAFFGSLFSFFFLCAPRLSSPRDLRGKNFLPPPFLFLLSPSFSPAPLYRQFSAPRCSPPSFSPPLCRAAGGSLPPIWLRRHSRIVSPPSFFFFFLQPSFFSSRFQCKLPRMRIGMNPPPLFPSFPFLHSGPPSGFRR